MMSANTSTRIRRSLRATGTLALVLLLAATLGACFDSSKSGTGPGGGGDSLHVSRQKMLDTGEVLFAEVCTACHNGGGVGSPGAVPPLAQSDFVMDPAHRLRPVRILLLGLPNTLDSTTPITVNGMEYGDRMGPVGFDHGWSNFQIASVLTYVRAILNDTLSANCQPDSILESGFAYCDKVARLQGEVNADSIAVWEVKAVRHSLDSLGLFDPEE